MTNSVNNQSIIPSTDVIQLTLTMKMTTAQVVEMPATVNNNNPIQDYVHLDYHTQPSYELWDCHLGQGKHWPIADQYVSSNESGNNN